MTDTTAQKSTFAWVPVFDMNGQRLDSESTACPNSVFAFGIFRFDSLARQVYYCA